MKKNIIVIFGGNSTEHDISIISGVEALNAMPSIGYKVHPIYIKNGIWYTGSALYEIRNYINFMPIRCQQVVLVGRELYEKNKRGKLKLLAEIDCALLATHGGDGENGTLQGFLEQNSLPYTSASVEESVICMNKILSKLYLKELKIAVVDGEELKLPIVKEQIERLEKTLGYPLMIKPATLGSSIGITYAKSREELLNGIAVAQAFSKKVLIEKGLENFCEINCAAAKIGGKIVLSEIEKPLTAHDFLSYEDKYICGTKNTSCGQREFPARLSDDMRAKVLATTKEVYMKLNLFGVVRIDYLIVDNTLYLNEINTIPGSLAHYLFKDISETQLLIGLIESGISRGVPQTAYFSSAVLQNIGAKHK